MLLSWLISAASALSLGGNAAAAGVAGFLSWAFQPVGPSMEAKAAMESAPPTKVDGLPNTLLFGGNSPSVALYCGAKIRPASYAPLARAVLDRLDGSDEGVLVLQSPFNVYAFKPASVARVVENYQSVRCITGHSIGGLWALEFCRDLHEAGGWPSDGLSFFHMGVHGKGVSLSPFRELPFAKVGWSYASEDCTMLRAADGDVEGYVARVRAELPEAATILSVAGGNHENYGSYGSPGPAQGLAYKDNPATIAAEVQHELVATAIAEVTRSE